jgi:hypothetical protein
VPEDAFDARVRDERVHQRGGGVSVAARRVRREDIDVAASLAAAPQAADGGEVHVRRVRAQVRDELRGGRCGIGQQMATGVALPLFERLQDERFLLRAHAFQFAQAAITCGRRKIVQRPDVQGGVQQGHGLRPDSLQAQDVQDRRRKLLQELLVIPAHAGVGKLPYLFRQILADPWHFAEPRVVEPCDRIGPGGDGFGCAAIRPDLERVFALDLQQVRNLRKDAGDRLVIHA